MRLTSLEEGSDGCLTQLPECKIHMTARRHARADDDEEFRVRLRSFVA